MFFDGYLESYPSLLIWEWDFRLKHIPFFPSRENVKYSYVINRSEINYQED